MSFKSIELFAGAGGLALGLEKAGFNTVLLNEIDSSACKTLCYNRPNWKVINGDIKNIASLNNCWLFDICFFYFALSIRETI